MSEINEPEAIVEGDYVRRLDLGADPFSHDFKCNYFFSGAMRQQVQEQLVHFSRFGDQVVVLTGSTGSGTSRLLDEVFEQLQDVMDYCDIDGELSASPRLCWQLWLTSYKFRWGFR